jgi:hypothetical protein
MRKLGRWLFTAGGIGCAASAIAQSLPDAIAELGEASVLTLHAEGAQVYECKADPAGRLFWEFREPVATLIEAGKTVGRHYAGPHWEHADGSVRTPPTCAFASNACSTPTAPSAAKSREGILSLMHSIPVSRLAGELLILCHHRRAAAAGNRGDRSGRSTPLMERAARGARRLTGSAQEARWRRHLRKTNLGGQRPAAVPSLRDKNCGARDRLASLKSPRSRCTAACLERAGAYWSDAPYRGA